MKKKILPYLLLAPMILIMGVLVFYPIITTFAYSLKRWKLTEPGNIHYIGFKNYIDILQSDSFKYSMQNTLFILPCKKQKTIGFVGTPCQPVKVWK